MQEGARRHVGHAFRGDKDPLDLLSKAVLDEALEHCILFDYHHKPAHSRPF